MNHDLVCKVRDIDCALNLTDWELRTFITYYRRYFAVCEGCAQAAFNELVSRSL